MVVNKPTIIIYTDDPDEILLKEIRAGIEEEGVLYQVSAHTGDLNALAFEAAKESMLGSGIGMIGQKAAMQMQRLPLGHNVFELDAAGKLRRGADDVVRRQFRSLGANSARAIKKLPFRELS